MSSKVSRTLGKRLGLTKLRKPSLIAVPSFIKKKAMKKTEKSPMPKLLIISIKPLTTEETSCILSNSGIFVILDSNFVNPKERRILSKKRRILFFANT